MTRTLAGALRVMWLGVLRNVPPWAESSLLGVSGDPN
jgi:hypothetical protein